MNGINRFFDWLNRYIADAELARRESYLARATDLCDLEYRIRRLEREAFALVAW